LGNVRWEGNQIHFAGDKSILSGWRIADSPARSEAWSLLRNAGASGSNDALKPACPKNSRRVDESSSFIVPDKY